MLPFSRDDFLANFGNYNLAIWPVQVFAYLAALVLIYSIIRRDHFFDRIATTVLALMWGWTGIAYHWLFFSRINGAAVFFAGLFLVQACLLAYAGFANRLRFAFNTSATGRLGTLLFFYATLVYPLWGFLAGEGYPNLPTFGVTPCPVTLFFLGAMLLTRAPVPFFVLIIPLIWSLIGGSAAFLLRMPQDWILLLSGVIAVIAIVVRDNKQKNEMTFPPVT